MFLCKKQTLNSNFFQSVLQCTYNGFTVQKIPAILYEKDIIAIGFGKTYPEIVFLSIGFLLRFCLNSLLFLMLAVAERTFKERFVTK